MSTNYVNRVAIHATAETSLPALAALGSNIAQATWAGASWKTLGATRRSDDVDLDADEIDYSWMDEKGEVRPPRSLTREATVVFADGVDSFEIPCYDSKQVLLDLDSEADSSGVIWEKDGELDYRAVAIEVAGLYVDYFPKCRVSVTSTPASYASDPAKTVLTVYPHATTAIPSGMQRHFYS